MYIIAVCVCSYFQCKLIEVGKNKESLSHPWLTGKESGQNTPFYRSVSAEDPKFVHLVIVLSAGIFRLSMFKLFLSLSDIVGSVRLLTTCTFL